jgi:hypothetical protein
MSNINISFFYDYTSQFLLTANLVSYILFKNKKNMNNNKLSNLKANKLINLIKNYYYITSISYTLGYNLLLFKYINITKYKLFAIGTNIIFGCGFPFLITKLIK